MDVTTDVRRFDDKLLKYGKHVASLNLANVNETVDKDNCLNINILRPIKRNDPILIFNNTLEIDKDSEKLKLVRSLTEFVLHVCGAFVARTSCSSNVLDVVRQARLTQNSSCILTLSDLKDNCCHGMVSSTTDVAFLQSTFPNFDDFLQVDTLIDGLNVDSNEQVAEELALKIIDSHTDDIRKFAQSFAIQTFLAGMTVNDLCFDAHDCAKLFDNGMYSFENNIGDASEDVLSGFLNNIMVATKSEPFGAWFLRAIAGHFVHAYKALDIATVLSLSKVAIFHRCLVDVVVGKFQSRCDNFHVMSVPLIILMFKSVQREFAFNLNSADKDFCLDVFQLTKRLNVMFDTNSVWFPSSPKEISKYGVDWEYLCPYEPEKDGDPFFNMLQLEEADVESVVDADVEHPEFRKALDSLDLGQESMRMEIVDEDNVCEENEDERVVIEEEAEEEEEEEEDVGMDLEEVTTEPDEVKKANDPKEVVTDSEEVAADLEGMTKDLEEVTTEPEKMTMEPVIKAMVIEPTLLVDEEEGKGEEEEEEEGGEGEEEEEEEAEEAVKEIGAIVLDSPKPAVDKSRKNQPSQKVKHSIAKNAAKIGTKKRVLLNSADSRRKLKRSKK
jgi:hypothetical protein